MEVGFAETSLIRYADPMPVCIGDTQIDYLFYSMYLYYVKMKK